MNVRKIVVPVIVTLLAMIGAFPVAADQMHQHQHEAMIQKHKPAAATMQEQGASATESSTETLLRYSNKTCPISGKPVDPKLFYDYKNEKSKTYGRIYTCCPDCLAKVAENPEKYYNKMYKKEKAVSEAKASPGGGANITCPVMGGKAKSDVAIEYNGKKVNFCCPGCMGKFQKDPGKYLKNLEKEKAAAK